MFYDIFNKCPDCGNGGLVQSHIQLDTGEYDGLPLSDFYFEDAMREVIRKTDHKYSLASGPKPEGFYVKIATSA